MPIKIFYKLVVVVVFSSLTLIGCDSTSPESEPEPQPILSLSITSLTFESDETEKTITIQNNGDGNLSWQAQSSQPWLSLSSSSGQAGDQITVSVDRSTLAPGQHEDMITFTSNGGNGQIAVSLTLTFEEVMAGAWQLVQGMNDGNTLDGLTATITFQDDGGYSASFANDTNTGSASGQFMVTDNALGTNLPDNLILNGISFGSSGGATWRTTLSCTRTAFFEYGGTAIAWSENNDLEVSITDGTLSLSTADGNVILTYERM